MCCTFCRMSFCPRYFRFMTEDFLYYVWRSRLFDEQDLQSTDGQLIQILHPGERNRQDGPDFFNAKIRIAGQLWAGNVELHVHASDWYKHNHHSDVRYDSVILHVVFFGSDPVIRSNQQVIPCLNLNGRIKKVVESRYRDLYASRDWVPCIRQIKSVPGLILRSETTRMFFERMEERAEQVFALLSKNAGDWEECFYRQLFRGFGFKVNAFPFELLASAVPYAILKRHLDQPVQVEALLFGQAGFLEREFKDRYPRLLQNEYSFLKAKYRLHPLNSEIWKHMALRPSNFPELRIAQLAKVVLHFRGLLSSLLHTDNLATVKVFFRNEVSVYWESHYVFDKAVDSRPKTMGEGSIDTILINAVLPILVASAKFHNDTALLERVVTFAEQLAAENNTITRQWKKAGIILQNAFDSQAYIQLKTRRCNQKRCLQCGIGNYLLKNV